MTGPAPYSTLLPGFSKLAYLLLYSYCSSKPGISQQINVFTLPNIFTSIAGITVQLVIPEGAIAAVPCTRAWIQPFSVKLS